MGKADMHFAFGQNNADPDLEQKKIIGGSFNVYESSPETEIT